MKRKTIFSLYFLSILFQLENSSNPNVANSILNDILSGIAPTTNNDSLITKVYAYNKNIRPSGLNQNKNVDSNGSLYIYLLLSLRQIISLDEKSQILTTSSFLYLKWNDPRLSWDSRNYSNVSLITIMASTFWLPDIAIMNSAGTSQFVNIPPSQNIMISNNGDSFLTLFLSGLSTRCKLNVYKYPYDKQNCSIIIGSWMYDTKLINFETDEEIIDTSNYIQHPIWHLENFDKWSKFSEGRFTLFDDANDKSDLQTETEDININLLLSRRPLYIMVNGIFPCFILNLVILLAFALPFASQVPLCMTSFLTFAVTGVRISSEIPVQSEYLPLVTLYILLSTVFTFIGFLWFIIINNFTQKKYLPKILKKIANIQMKILFWIFELPKKVEPKNHTKKDCEPTQRNNEPSKLNIEYVDHDLNKQNDCIEIDAKNEKKSTPEDEKKKAQALLDSQIVALNYSAFLIVFLIIFLSNLIIWVSISY